VNVLYLSRGYSPHDHRFLSAIASAAQRTYFSRLEPDLVYESRPLPPGVEEVDWTRSIEQPAPEAEVLRSLGDLIERVKPDLVHAGPIPTVAYAAAKTGFSPLVSMSWGSDILVDAQAEPARSAARFSLGQSTLAFADCNTVREELASLGMPDERIVVFPWGVDLEHFSPQPTSPVRKRLGWEKMRVVLSTRSLEPHYGAEVVVEGFTLAARQDSSLRLIQLGQGSLQNQLEVKLADTDMKERVHFTGQVDFDRLPEYYNAADLYVTASQADGSSISLLEAMASGLPSLVSDIPGNREWVMEGETGWLFPVGNSQQLAEGLLQAFENVDQLRTMGSQARRVAEKRANWKQSVEIMLSAYERVLKEAG
jgi:glycosyltransferase involved in cell wall biosynthesis